MLFQIENDTLPSGAKRGTAMIDFYAQWCTPCALLAPVVERISDSYDVFQCDIDRNPDLAASYGIMSVPTLVILRDGQVRDRMVGVQSEQQICTQLEAVK